MRRILVAILLGLVLPGLAAASTPPTQEQQLAKIETQTQRIRQLSQLHPVKAVFPSDAAFNRDLQAEMEAQTPPADLQIGQEEDSLLGVIGKSDSLRHILFQNLGAQVEGFYDYQHKVLYVRDSGNAFSGAWRWTISHEYTHALQDQHFNLLRLLPSDVGVQYRNTDAEAAHHALTEGDAVLTQGLFINRTYTPADLQALITAQQHLPKTPPVPKAIEYSFNFPYTTGVTFVKKLYARGGMPAVTAAYARLPASTYEIMYPGAYFRGWRLSAVALHTVQGFTDWQRQDDDVFGAFGYYLLLWQRLGATAANSVVQGYLGDRYIFLTKPAQEIMLFKSIWATHAAAQLAERTLVDALRLRYHHRIQVTKGTGQTAVEVDGAVYFGVAGKHLTMAYAPTAALAQQAGTAPTT